MLIGIVGAYAPMPVVTEETRKVNTSYHSRKEIISAGSGLLAGYGFPADALEPRKESLVSSFEEERVVPRTGFSLRPDCTKCTLDKRPLIRSKTMRRSLSPRNNYFGRTWSRRQIK